MPSVPFGAGKGILERDPGADKTRLRIERRLRRRIADALAEAGRRVVALLRRSGPDKWAVLADGDFWSWLEQRLRQATMMPLEEAALLGVRVGLEQVGIGGQERKQLSVGIDWGLVNRDVLEWVRQYNFELVSGLQDTTRQYLQTDISNWIESGEPLGKLIARLADKNRYPFGAVRADMIAATEVTRAYYEGNQRIWKASGVVELQEWRTAADDRVCPICRPLGGLDGGEPVRAKLGEGFRHPSGEVFMPPAHPRCRCWAVPVIEYGMPEAEGHA